MEESFWRDHEIHRQASSLPAATYNLAVSLLAKSPQGHVFVPIRSMQYLAVIDREEIIFVDRERPRDIELAWQHFRPSARSALDEPVPFELVFYFDKARETMKRLPREFYQALALLASRRLPPGPARVLKLHRR